MRAHPHTCYPQYDPSLYSHSMTTKGIRQAERNDSEDIWSLIGGSSKSRNCAIPHSSHSRIQQMGEGSTQGCQKSTTRQLTGREQPDRVQPDRRQPDRGQPDPDRIKRVSFHGVEQRGSGSGQKSFQLTRPTNLTGSPRKHSQSKPQPIKKRQMSQNKSENNEVTKQQLEERRIYLQECYSIQKYLQNMKPYTRTMADSTVKLFYERPCLESYGRKNTSGSNGFMCNDYLKTHNVQPHRHQNEPIKYQTYRSSLNFAKRSKLAPEDRWRKIHRQMAKRLDMKALVENFAHSFVPIDEANAEEMLKVNINSLKGEQFRKSKSLDCLKSSSAARQMAMTVEDNKNDMNSTMDTNRLSSKYQSLKGKKDSIVEDEQLEGTRRPRGKQDAATEEEDMGRVQKLKRSKSWGKKECLFLYKYTNSDGENQYAKDRHGVTCFVDPNFEENKEAYTRFLRKVAPIEAEDVRPDDRNIDKVMVRNYLQAQQDDIQSHYLVPNCDQPYRPQKYSFRARKGLTVVPKHPYQ